jgi:hypothetical protein
MLRTTPYISRSGTLSVPALLKSSTRPLCRRQDARMWYGTALVVGPVVIEPVW